MHILEMTVILQIYSNQKIETISFRLILVISPRNYRILSRKKTVASRTLTAKEKQIKQKFLLNFHFSFWRKLV